MTTTNNMNNQISSRGIALSQLQAQIKRLLATGFEAPVWIIAEIGELKVNYSSGHCYMELVEKGGANGVPKAQARAVAWRNVWAVLSSFFEGATGKPLGIGMKVMLSVSVTYHELYGLSLNIRDIDPLYTIGDLERQKQETIAKLKSDGVFDLNRESEIPMAPQRIAVISSPSAAGFQDFMNELEISPYRFDIYLYEAIMQGHGAESSIIDALSRVVADWEEYDAVILIRGGGSQSDLSFLNSYMLCSHIAQYPLPVITGLGHDKDQSIADMVAAVALKTPTAVAGYLVARADETFAKLENLTVSVSDAVMERLSTETDRLRVLATELQSRAVKLSRGIELRLERLSGEAARRSREIIMRRSERLDAMRTLLGERSSRVLAATRNRIEHSERLADSYDPQHILARGFAIVHLSGTAIRESDSVRPGDIVEITLYKGEAKAEIKETKYGK